MSFSYVFSTHRMVWHTYSSNTCFFQVQVNCYSLAFIGILFTWICVYALDTLKRHRIPRSSLLEQSLCLQKCLQFIVVIFSQISASLHVCVYKLQCNSSLMLNLLLWCVLKYTAIMTIMLIILMWNESWLF